VCAPRSTLRSVTLVGVQRAARYLDAACNGTVCARRAQRAHTRTECFKVHELVLLLAPRKVLLWTNPRCVARRESAEPAPTKYTSLQVPFGVNSWWERAPHIVWRRCSAAPQGRHMPRGRARRGGRSCGTHGQALVGSTQCVWVNSITRSGAFRRRS
jgi:hypothetical protein